MVLRSIALVSIAAAVVAIVVAISGSVDHLGVWSLANDSDASETEPSSCERRREHGECGRKPLQMAHQCPLRCEEDLVESKLRKRILLRDVVPASTAAQLAKLAPNVVKSGDGYSGKAKALSSAEFFGGITPKAAVLWAKEQQPAEYRKEAMEWARAYIKTSGMLQRRLEKEFDVGLSFDYIHLTCRTRDETFSGVAKDSHVTHADNCFQQENECIRDSPMYFWRSHSCILSLHSGDGIDFDGGDFFFTPTFHANSSQRVRVTPAAGTAIAFVAGEENIHGVEEVKRGTRCQVALWLTEDHSKAAHSKELKEALELLDTDTAEVQAARNDQVSQAQEKYQELCSPSAVNRVRHGRHVADLPLVEENRSLSVEILNELPGSQISMIRDLVTKEEIDHIIAKASPNFKRAVVFSGENLVEAKYRTSETSWLADDPTDAVLTRILSRMSKVTGLSLESSEQLQVALYKAENQGRYDPHMDWGADRSVTRHHATTRTGENIGARVATLLVYLNTVEDGGNTVFTWNNISVVPEAGSAIFWYNLHPGREGDVMVHHGACPVLKGNKYIMTKWIHEHGNDAVFDGGMGLPRLARDWQKLAAKLRGDTSQEEPFVEGLDCQAHLAAGGCMMNPVAMARACPGRCQDRLVESPLRGRRLIEDVIGPEVAQKLLKLVGEAGKPGVGFDGKERPFSVHEKVSGLSLVDAARWAVGHQPQGRAAEAIAAARAYLAAVEAMLARVAERYPGEKLRLGHAQLVCREADKLDATGDKWIIRDKAISAGSDITVSNMTEAEAKSFCLASPECEGFTHLGPPTNKSVLTYVKTKYELYGKGYGWTTYLKAKEPQILDSQPANADDCLKTDPTEGAWQKRTGWIEAGGDVFYAHMTTDAAKVTCQDIPECKGFTHKGDATDVPVGIYFKDKFNYDGSGWTSYEKLPPEECARKSPVAEWQTHGAELFLHGPESGDFAGGDFFYTPTWDSPVFDRIRLKPETGRMVAYSVGSQNIHGIEEVKRGKRCSLVASFHFGYGESASELASAREILDPSMAS